MSFERRDEHDGEAEGPFSDPEEERAFHAVLNSFRNYRQAAHYNVTHLRRHSFYALPAAQQELLSSPPFNLPGTFKRVDQAIESNAEIAEAILEVGLAAYDIDPADETFKDQKSARDLDKARTTIRQLYRDWSTEGLPERHAAFTPFLDALERHLPSPPSKRCHLSILVPGAGLGRLVFDICCAGYTVEGNEISYHQLLTSNYILNCVQRAGQHRLYPWALSFSNHLTRADQFHSVLVPDINPAAVLTAAEAEIQPEKPFSERMSMSAADFCVVYRQPDHKDAFDAVATCFFIDTAPNVIRYVETVRNCLRAGGIWINLGPLLWHFEAGQTPSELERQGEKRPENSLSEDDGIGEPGNFELSNHEVLALLDSFGFEIVEQREASATGYIQDPRSMLQNVYRPVFWVARNK